MSQPLRFLFAVLMLTVGFTMNWPVHGADGEHVVCSLSVSDFRTALRGVSFAMGAETPRYDLNGVLIEADHKTLTLIATDGGRMATVELPIKNLGSEGSSVQIFISRTIARAIQESLDGVVGECTLDLGTEQIVITAGKLKTQQASRQPRFPNWRAIVPKTEGTLQAKFKANDLLGAVVRASPWDSSSGHTVWTIEKGELEIVSSPDKHAGTSARLAVAHSGPRLSIHLDHRYVVSYLRIFEPDTMIHIAFHGPDGAVLFSAGAGYRYVVMPIAPE